MRRIVPLLPLVICAIGCGDDGTLTRLRASAVFEPEALSFGEVGVNLSATKNVVFRNTGQAPFVVETVEGAPSFTVKGLDESRTIPGGTIVELEATYLALQEGGRDETLIVRDGDVEIQLQLSAMGVVRMVPQLEITPEALDFGVVEVGGAQRLPFSIDNNGNAPATIDSAVFETSSGAFSVLLPPGIIVQEGIKGVFTVTFSPGAEGDFTDRLVLNIAELADPVVIPMTGEGGDPAGAIFCTPAAVVFEELPRGQTDRFDVSCFARGADVTVLDVAFEGETSPFAVTPPGLPLMIQRDGSFMLPIEFAPDGLPGEVEGRMIISYRNDRGDATVAVPVTGLVRAPLPEDQAISVTLTWDKANTDVDLHLLQPEGALFDTAGRTDCHYALKDPDWGAAGDTTDNPFLDVDDVDGIGPETINMARVADGSYEIHVHHFKARDNGPIVATVDVLIGGQSVATEVSEPLDDRAFWEVGSIDYDGGSGTFSAAGGLCECVVAAPRPVSLLLVVGFALGLGLRRRRR